MKTVIFATRSVIRNSKFKEILGNIGDERIKVIRINRNESFAELHDGSIYWTMSTSENSKGRKFDQAYVSIDTPSDIINYIIKPSLTSSILPTSEQIIFY